MPYQTIGHNVCAKNFRLYGQVFSRVKTLPSAPLPVKKRLGLSFFIQIIIVAK